MQNACLKWEIKIKRVTDDEEHLHNDICDNKVTVLVLMMLKERGVVGHHDGYVERAQQTQPVPGNAENAVVTNYEASVLQTVGFVLWHHNVRFCRRKILQC